MPYFLLSSPASSPGILRRQLTSSMECLTRNSRLVTKVYFPREVVPARIRAGAFVDFCIAATVIIPFYLYFLHVGEVRSHARLLLLPFILLIQATLAAVSP